ncbi:hypothetical protein KKF91_21050 [Myxococcota bacterium]|nr:hypothetical protein [Myxococcota bacterium]MBU1433032.1 hypothetical protein [Myxococcota bacterium]MBU1899933.1 hypothetical protein [Myxococcota bacterium]
MRYLTPLLLTLLACADPAPGPAPEPQRADATVYPRASITHTLTLEILDRAGGAAEGAPLRLSVEGGDASAVIYEVGDPTRITLDLVEGAYRLTAFRDRGDDGADDACPFPPLPEHVEIADELDNVRGVLSLELRKDTRATLTLERSICGPGEPLTGLEGIIQAPNEAASSGPVWMLLEPLAATPEGAAPQPILRVPIFPEGLQGARPFSFGELLPGFYQLTVFVDEDEDACLTLCGGPLSGGDRLWARRARIEIQAGARATLEEILTLEAADCAAEMTGLRGAVTLALVNSEAAEIAEEGAPRYAGALMAALFNLEGQRLYQRTLLEHLDARPTPLPFTLTGIAPGDYTLALWLDRDADGGFSPCGGLISGWDLLSLRQPVRVTADQITDSGLWALEAGHCEDDQGIEGAISVEIEAGPMSTGRPVRLELYPLEAEGARRSVLLFENHAQLTGMTPFIRTEALPQGVYRARVYIDTDQDGRFLSCEASPWADRSSTETFIVEIDEGARVDLGRRVIAPIGCPVPQIELWPVFGLSDLGASAPFPLRVEIEERGGWRDDRLLMERFEPYTPARLLLTPGRFRLTAYLDSDADERFTPCGRAGADHSAAQLELELGAHISITEVELQLSRCAP